MRWAAVSIGVLILLFAGYWAVMHLVLAPSCRDQIVHEASSPDGSYVADVLERECGATTRTEWVVMLRKRSDRFRPDDYHEWVFTSDHRQRIETDWADSTHLVIKSERSDQSPNPVPSWRSVRIVRQTLR